MKDFKSLDIGILYGGWSAEREISIKSGDTVFNCLAHVKVGSCHRCRYLKQKDKSFDCVTPGSWRRIGEPSKRKKDLQFWNTMLSKLEQ